MDLTRPVLVTGASGKTGSKVVAALSKRKAKVRALICRIEATDKMNQLGAAETVLGDFFDDDSLRAAIEGSSCVIHICPPMNPDETDIPRRMTDHCLAAGTERLILYSVLHPLIKDVPHHKKTGDRALSDQFRAES